MSQCPECIAEQNRRENEKLQLARKNATAWANSHGKTKMVIIKTVNGFGFRAADNLNGVIGSICATGDMDKGEMQEIVEYLYI